MSARSLLAVLWIALLALGCREGDIAKLEQVKREVCACADAACGEAAIARVPVIEKAGDRRSQLIARGMLDCLAKLYAKERPTTGPDGESSSDGSAAVPAP